MAVAGGGRRVTVIAENSRHRGGATGGGALPFGDGQRQHGGAEPETDEQQLAGFRHQAVAGGGEQQAVKTQLAGAPLARDQIVGERWRRGQCRPRGVIPGQGDETAGRRPFEGVAKLEQLAEVGGRQAENGPMAVGPFGQQAGTGETASVVRMRL